VPRRSQTLLRALQFFSSSFLCCLMVVGAVVAPFTRKKVAEALEVG
jgi:hypothetical protein